MSLVAAVIAVAFAVALLRRESRPAGADPGGRHEGRRDGRLLLLLRLPAGCALRAALVRRTGVGRCSCS